MFGKLLFFLPLDPALLNSFDIKGLIFLLKIKNTNLNKLTLLKKAVKYFIREYKILFSFKIKQGKKLNKK